jgi:N6-L-threonylcarbamoyladenine synthase
MKILGIETSCDETAVCLLEAEGQFGADFRFKILGNGLSSQAELHAQYGGVYPNLAKREHARNLVPMLTEALQQASELKNKTPHDTLIYQSELKQLLEREPELLERLVPFLEMHDKPDIDAIAVTAGPGLEPALWVGINFAKALALVWEKPIVAVDHMEGHIMLSSMENDHFAQFEFPSLALLISGGHTELVLSREFMHYEIVGQTRDDAVGESFDKVARMLDLGYPGGPLISKLAAEARQGPALASVKFTRPMLHEDNFDFSFSGLKTAVRNMVKAHEPLTDEMKKMISREFEDCVADTLVGKTLRAVDSYSANTVIVGGGVSANTYIRKKLSLALEEGNIAKLLVPPPELATDNAVMIALAGYFHAIKKEFADPGAMAAKGNLRLGSAK